MKQPKITLGGKEYPCEVKNGVRYVNGLTIDEFINTLPPDQLIEAYNFGRLVKARENEQESI